LGLSEIKRKYLLKSAKDKKKMEIMFKELEEIIKKIKDLRENIKRFQKRWGKYISEKPEIINMLSLELLGIENLSKDLEMKIALDILSVSKEKNSTLIPLSDLITYVKEKNIGIPITLNSVEKALKNLLKRKLIKGLIVIDGVKYVQIKDFNSDIETILKTFENKETITITDIVRELGWDIKRAEKTLEEMEKIGLVVKEEYPPRYHLVKFD